jgi:hypothetical protein
VSCATESVELATLVYTTYNTFTRFDDPGLDDVKNIFSVSGIIERAKVQRLFFGDNNFSRYSEHVTISRRLSRSSYRFLRRALERMISGTGRRRRKEGRKGEPRTN